MAKEYNIEKAVIHWDLESRLLITPSRAITCMGKSKEIGQKKASLYSVYSAQG